MKLKDKLSAFFVSNSDTSKDSNGKKKSASLFVQTPEDASNVNRRVIDIFGSKTRSQEQAKSHEETATLIRNQDFEPRI